MYSYLMYNIIYYHDGTRANDQQLIVNIFKYIVFLQKVLYLDLNCTEYCLQGQTDIVRSH